MKKITFIKGGVYNILRLLFHRSFFFCISLSLISCATIPQENYLTNKDISKIRKVAIIVSANLPEVSYSIITPGSAFEAAGIFDTASLLAFPFTLTLYMVGPLILFPATGVEAAIRSGVDRKHAEKITDHINLSLIEDRVAQSFLHQLKKEGCFQTIELLKDKNHYDRQLAVTNYDAVIRLSVHKIILERVAGDNVRFYAHLNGQMECLSTKQIMWDREEIVASSEPRSLDYFKENGLKELDVLLEKAAKNLSYDFLYLK